MRELEALLASKPSVNKSIADPKLPADPIPDQIEEPSLGTMYFDGGHADPISPPRQHNLPAIGSRPHAAGGTSDGDTAGAGRFTGLRPLLGPDGMLISYSGSPSFSRAMSEMRSMSAPSTPLPPLAESPQSHVTHRVTSASASVSPTRSGTRESLDSFGTYVNAPRSIPAFNLAGASSSSPFDVRGSSDMEEELHASRKSFERSNTSLAHTNARLILQVSSHR